jgi:hypothetical protein
MAAGDLDRASQAMLRVLALDLTQPDAAQHYAKSIVAAHAHPGQWAAKVRIEDKVAIAGTMRTSGRGRRRIRSRAGALMLRAGDAPVVPTKARRCEPGNRATRQRIGAAVAERARELGPGCPRAGNSIVSNSHGVRGEGGGRGSRVAAVTARGFAGLFRQGFARVPQRRAGDHVFRDQLAVRPATQAALKLRMATGTRKAGKDRHAKP